MYKIYTNNVCTPPGYIKKILLIMKITTIFLFAALMQVSAAGLAQRLTLVKKDATLKQIFDAVNKQTNYNFVWSADQLNINQPVNADFKDTPLLEVLDKCLANTGLTYTIEDKTVVIKKKEESLLDRVKAAFAQVTIKGKVIDSVGNPLTSVTIKEKGTNNATISDTKGAYTLTVTDNNAILTFSSIGYQTRELPAKELTNGQVITLVATVTSLREVAVLNKGYYFEKQELSTGDVTIVSGKEIEQQPVDDPIKALEGRVAGLVITQTSGLPGSNEGVRLRGQNSIANGNNPLYIIDGVPFTSASLTNTQVGGGAVGFPSPQGYIGNTPGGLSPFSALNKDDIANIEILKDADATAIYGSRGANGVILITTKKGQAGNTKVTIDLSEGNGKVAHFMDLMNTQQYLQMRHQAFALGGLTPNSSAYDINGTWDTTRYTNWQKVLLGNTAHNTNAQISVSGGNENTQFYVGGGFTRNTTVFPGDYNDAKGSLNFSLTHSSADKRFQLQFSGGYMNDNNNLPQTDLTSTALTLAPDAPALYNANGSLNWQPVGGTATWNNPLSYTLKTANAVTNNLTSNMLLSYRILPGLQVKSSFGYTDDQLTQANLSPDAAVAPPNNNTANNRNNYFGNSEFKTWIIEPQLTYDRKIAKGTLNVLLGVKFDQEATNSIGYRTSGYNSDALIANPANASTFQFAGETNSLYRENTIVARIGYTWDDKYLLNLTANRDGSSRFGPDKQWGNFGAIGTGWIFSKERFIADNLPWLSFGKLRGSYGITGSDQITNYQYLSSYSTDASTYQGNTGLFPTRIANPYYGWETDKKLEGGIELGFLKDRINFVASFYRERSDNQLVGYPLPAITGFATVQDNLPAVVQNTSAEFIVNTINIKSTDFKWSTSLNMTIPSNKLLSYPGLATSSYAQRYDVGQSLYIQHLLTGVQVNPADGKYEYAGANGETENPTYSTDLKFTSPVTQKWYGGLGNTFSYKGLQLDFLFMFVKQTGFNYWTTRNEVNAGLFVGGTAGNQPVAIIGNTWQQPGDISKYGRLSTQGASDPNSNLLESTFGIGDASFIRLRNLALSYTLPKSWQQAMHLQNVRIYLQGENLLTFTNYFGLDPESSSNGSGLPPLRMITLGIHASL
jgi:TonB-linked SusC/RagA family outer membrane protein